MNAPSTLPRPALHFVDLTVIDLDASVARHEGLFGPVVVLAQREQDHLRLVGEHLGGVWVSCSPPMAYRSSQAGPRLSSRANCPRTPARGAP